MISTFLKAKALKDITGRVAANIVEGLKEIETSNIYLRFMGAQVNAKSLVGLLSLDIKQDEDFEIYIISKDDVAAATDLEKLLRAIEPYCEMILID
jgi:phosphotransferase system HPr (HPr) family protein